ncbi:MAG: winged helix DNA-binding domain-containing protein [Gammaproteobacteria bacterium]|nr:winged helix DNA-binding domain-containing protein [Gammaproteobacteria bacterium]
MESLTIKQVRRLALLRAGLLKPVWTGLPSRAAGKGKRARGRCHQVIDRFGYLQLDTVSVAGARTHSIVLTSRLGGFDASLGEQLLNDDKALFEYWGHEACWIPMSLYPHFEFRRRDFRVHPWWGDILGEHKKLAQDLLRRIDQEGPLRSMDLEGASGQGWWDIKIAKRVAEALWSAGDLAIRERKNFHRYFDLTERVIPESARDEIIDDEKAIDTLLLKALDGHGWAATGTLAATWRWVNMKEVLQASLERLVSSNQIVACQLETKQRNIPGWIRPSDLELIPKIDALRPRRDKGVLLSPFDPVLWDRNRVKLLFDFDQKIEIYKPAEQRRFGYYCLPVLAGEHLIGRVDLKADRKKGVLKTLSCHFEEQNDKSKYKITMVNAVNRYAESVGLVSSSE